MKHRGTEDTELFCFVFFTVFSVPLCFKCPRVGGSTASVAGEVIASTDTGAEEDGQEVREF